MTEREQGTEAKDQTTGNEHGISLESYKNAKTWAHEWYELLKDLPVEYIDQSVFKAGKSTALAYVKDVKIDVNGKPSFREEFTATELVLDMFGDRSEEIRSTLYGEDIRPIPHFDRLDMVLDTLLAQRDKNGFPYYLEAAQLPQDERNMPPSLTRGGKDHANFLFTTCYYMRGGIKSFAAFRGLSALYEEDPSLFNPKDAKSREASVIAEALASVGLGFSKNVISNQWISNAAKLEQEYDGDARNIFEGTTDYRELLRRIQNKNGNGFKGFQEKMTSMLAYFLMADKLIPYFDFPLPVDFHVLRVSAATEMITFENIPSNGNIYHQKTLDLLRDMYHDYSVTHGISQLEVCDAVWSLSSAICGDQPGNIMLEPNRSEGRQGRSTYIEPLPININDRDQQKRYERTCGLCVLDDVCTQNFPSKKYYVQGLMIPSPRIQFPKDTLF